MTEDVARNGLRSSRPVALAGILIIYILMRLPGIGIPLDRDEGVFGYIGQTINRGGLPYREALDHKPPFAFYINALALHFVPPTAQGMHIFALVYNLLTLICLYFLAKAVFRSVAGGWCCAFAYAVFSASPAIHGFTASTELYAILPTTLSLLLAVRAAGKSSALLMLLSGVTGAAACWTKQTAFTTVLFGFVFACVASWRRDRRMPFIWLAGAVSFSALLAFYFYAQGIFASFIYWCFTYELAYTSVPFSDTLEKMQLRWADIARGDFLIPAAGLAVALWALVRKRPHGMFLTGYLVFSFAGTVLGYTYPHYFVQLAPAIALAGGYALYLLVEARRLRVALLCGLLAVGISLGANRNYFFSTDKDALSIQFFAINPFPEARIIAAALDRATRPDEKILILGSEPEILFEAQRESATPFVIIYPLTSVHARYKEFQKTLWDSTLAHPPGYIVAPAGIPPSIDWDGDADLRIIRNFCDLLASDYALVNRTPLLNREPWPDPTHTCLDSETPSIDVYRRKLSPSGGSGNRRPSGFRLASGR